MSAGAGPRDAAASGKVAPDPARLAEGWELRFVADEVRAAEMTQLYRELDFETAVDPVRPADVRQDCEDCPLVTLRRLRIIYTRARSAARSA